MPSIEIPASAMKAMPPQLTEMLYQVKSLVSADILFFGVLFYLFSKAWNILVFFYNHFLKSSLNFKKCYGSWAIVTGATDGIGKAMSHEFAKKGMNVLLISRTQSKLDNCAKEMNDKYPNVEIKVLAVDFNEINDTDVRKRISKTIKDLDVGVLVNNVGVSYEFPKFIHELTDEESESLTVLNVDSTTWMTRLVLDGDNGMIARKTGAIVNISSVAGVLTSPLLSHYGGAKGFIAQYSRALHYELAPKGIHVQCQVPFFVTTKLAKLRKASLTVASESQYARAAIKAIGSSEPVLSPYWSHAIQFYLYNNFPEWIFAKVANSMHLGIRKAGMKKKANASKKA